MSDRDRSEEDENESDPFDEDEPEADRFGDEVFDDEPSAEADDPFEPSDADEVDDPFAALGEGVEGSAGPADEPDPAGDSDPAEGPDPEASPGSDPEPGAPADDPFAELDASAGEATGDEDPFESMESGDVGEEDVWAALDEGTSVGADAGGRSLGASDTGATADERVVDKRSYCQRCPHFTEPPETACTHEGTEIVESVDFSRFRVRNCPMVDAEDPAFDGE